MLFEAYRGLHSGGISTNEEWIRDWLRTIRQKVVAGKLDQATAVMLGSASIAGASSQRELMAITAYLR